MLLLNKLIVIFKISFFTSAADVKMEIAVLVRSLKPSILSLNCFQTDKTVWGVGSAKVAEQKFP